MSKWRYFVVSGSPTAFYLPIIEQTNLKCLEKDIEDWLVEMVWADPTALPPWCPGSRQDASLGYNGASINSNFFLVRIHRYPAGAQEIDLSSASIVRAYLFCYDESRQYGKQWQVLRLNNPKHWVGEDASESFIYAQEYWEDLWSDCAHTRLDDEYLRYKLNRDRMEAQMGLWENLLGNPDVESYGGTD